MLSAIASSSSWLNTLRSVPLGRYWRISPLVFSQMPRCQGLYHGIDEFLEVQTLHFDIAAAA